MHVILLLIVYHKVCQVHFASFSAEVAHHLSFNVTVRNNNGI